jgi:hypothetical protein
MKTAGVILIIALGLALSSCGSKEAIEVSPGESLVYLKVAGAHASSFDDTPDWAPQPDPMAAVDGDMLTRWSPKLGLDNEWIYFDFGVPKVLSRILIRWEEAHAVDYEVLTSSNAKSWKRLILMKGQDGGIDEIEVAPVKTRFVKIIGLKRNNPKWGFSIWELEMYGPKSLNPGEKGESRTLDDIEEKKKELEKALSAFKATPRPLTLTEFHKGVVYTSWNHSELGSMVSDLTLTHLRKLGVGHIAIMAPAYQETIDSSEIVTHDFPGGDTPTDEAIVHAIETAHSLGMKVMLKPHIDCLDGTFRGDIIPSKAWFESYKKTILRYARLAGKNKVEMFCVGTELENTSFFRWEHEWRSIIASVKEVYKGYLTYSANWTEYEHVSFWDSMDLIGIDAYFPLTEKNDPTKDELLAGWEGVADKIEAWLKGTGFNKNVIFTELGYVSSDGTNREPWATLTNAEDQEEQADALGAALGVLHKRNWFKGMYLWQYFPREIWSPLGYPVRGKEAEGVLSEWYKKL